jgi:hypothetical protein
MAKHKSCSFRNFGKNALSGSGPIDQRRFPLEFAVGADLVPPPSRRRTERSHTHPTITPMRRRSLRTAVPRPQPNGREALLEIGLTGSTTYGPIEETSRPKAPGPGRNHF